jgi:rhodanese-related sulfurtransferase
VKTLVLILALGYQLNAFASGTECAKESNYPEVSKAELTKIVQEKSAFIIDVNSKKSFAKSHVPGAVHFAQIEKNFADALPKDKAASIVAYCGGVMCTAWKEAAKKACEMGYKNVKHFKEGITGWDKKS